jgi:hypothetical protein
LQVRGCCPRQRLLDDPRGDRPDPRGTLQGAAPAPLLELRIGKCPNDGGRIAKGTYAVGRFAFAFEDVRNALQSFDGVVPACQVRWAVRIDPYILRLQAMELRLRLRPLTRGRSATPQAARASAVTDTKGGYRASANSETDRHLPKVEVAGSSPVSR